MAPVPKESSAGLQPGCAVGLLAGCSAGLLWLGKNSGRYLCNKGTALAGPIKRAKMRWVLTPAGWFFSIPAPLIEFFRSHSRPGSPTNDLYSLGWRSLALGDRGSQPQPGIHSRCSRSVPLSRFCDWNIVPMSLYLEWFWERPVCPRVSRVSLLSQEQENTSRGRQASHRSPLNNPPRNRRHRPTNFSAFGRDQFAVTAKLRKFVAAGR